MVADIVLESVASYLIGCLSLTWVLGKVVGGVDLREYDDGVVGGSNLSRATGSYFWMLVGGLFDIFKGYVAVSLFHSPHSAAFAMAGHMFPFWLGFHGGNAVSVFTGAMLAQQEYLLTAIFLVIFVGLSKVVQPLLGIDKFQREKLMFACRLPFVFVPDPVVYTGAMVLAMRHAEFLRRLSEMQ